jgi:hypothetical protein
VESNGIGTALSSSLSEDNDMVNNQLSLGLKFDNCAEDTLHFPKS